MRRVVDEPGLRDRLARGALERARSFTWDLTADRTVDVYGQAERAMRDDLEASA